MNSNEPRQGEACVVRPGEAAEYWQPVPANGHIAVHISPKIVAMDCPIGFGTQTVAAGCYVREHAHDRHEELVHCISGQGRVVIDGIEHDMAPGTTVFIGKNRRHMFIADKDRELHFSWLILPNGLEDFFEAIGRKKTQGEPAPEPFPRPENVLEIERRTVFAPPVKDGFKI